MRKPEDIKIGDLTLKEIIEKYQHYVNQDCENWKSRRTVLCSGVDLYNIDLADIDLSYANLYNINLNGANLRGANLTGVNLMGADLFGANLWNAKLCDANLEHSDLCTANLCGADLSNASLKYANLEATNLYGADLSNADLEGAILQGANLCFTNGKIIKRREGKILTEPIIGYKKCMNNIIVTLEIPRGAIVFSINENKCRTNKAKVISIDGADRAYSRYNDMSYYVGDEFTIYNFDCRYNIECGEGIHFFMSREKAESY